MIKFLEELKQKNPELYEAAFIRLKQNPKYPQFACRFTPKELQKAARFLDTWGMQWDTRQHDAFMAKFTQTERDIIELFVKTNKPEKIEGLEQKIRIMNDRLARNVKGIIADIEDQRELEELIRKQKEKRGEVVNSMSEDWRNLQSIFG